MKKILFSLIGCIFISLSLHSTCHASTIENNGFFYIDTDINELSLETVNDAGVTRSNKTASKTYNYRDANQNILWYVTITATFTYDGTTSSCTSCYPQAGANDSHWSIKSCTSSMSGNSATATAIATQTLIFGITHDYTGSVTIYCAPDGTIS